MGFECEQEFVQMIGSEEEILAAIAPSLEEGHRAQVFSQLQVISHEPCHEKTRFLQLRKQRRS